MTESLIEKLLDILNEIDGISNEDYKTGGFLTGEIPADWTKQALLDAKRLAGEAISLIENATPDSDAVERAEKAMQAVIDEGLMPPLFLRQWEALRTQLAKAAVSGCSEMRLHEAGGTPRQPGGEASGASGVTAPSPAPSTCRHGTDLSKHDCGECFASSQQPVAPYCIHGNLPDSQCPQCEQQPDERMVSRITREIMRGLDEQGVPNGMEICCASIAERVLAGLKSGGHLERESALPVDHIADPERQIEWKSQQPDEWQRGYDEGYLRGLKDCARRALSRIEDGAARD